MVWLSFSLFCRVSVLVHFYAPEPQCPILIMDPRPLNTCLCGYLRLLAPSLSAVMAVWPLWDQTDSSVASAVFMKCKTAAAWRSSSNLHPAVCLHLRGAFSAHSPGTSCSWLPMSSWMLLSPPPLSAAIAFCLHSTPNELRGAGVDQLQKRLGKHGAPPDGRRWDLSHRPESKVC